MRTFFATPGRWLGLIALAVLVSAPALAQRNVTLRMNAATLPDTIRADADLSGAQLRGCLVDCEGGQSALPGGETIAWDSNTTLTPESEGGDYWSVDFQIPDNEELRFKFYFEQAEESGVGGWEDNGPVDGNYAIPAGTGDVTLDLHYFNKTGSQQPYDWRPFAAEGDSVAVWFRVYMNTVSAVEKGYDADDDGLRVGVRGNFGTLGAVDSEGDVVDWGEGGDTDEGVTLARESDDDARPGYHLFSGLAKFPASAAGEDVSYKFFFGDSDTEGNGGYEDDINGGNRSFTVPAAGTDTTLHWVYYSASPPLGADVQLVTSNVTFTVDVSPLTTIGLLDTTTDEVQVRGGFNGWDCPEDNQDDCLLTQLPFGSEFSREFPIRSQAGSVQNYKYFIDFNPDFTDPSGGAIADFGFEEPLDFGGGDRPFTFEGNATQSSGTQFFNSIRPGNLIADGQSIDVTFSVDMEPATQFQVEPFDPAQDTVSVQFEDNIWLLTQGYEPNNTTDLITRGGEAAIRGFTLSDPDGDLVYTGTLTVEGPTYNGIGYRYYYYSGDAENGSEAAGGVVEGSGGFGEGRRRYRYITDRTADAFDFALDTFRPTQSPSPVPWEVNPTGDFDPSDFANAIANGQADTGVISPNEAGPGRSGALALGPVFPNPVSGVARVSVSSALGEAVTVRVYDVTGRQVASVLEGGAVEAERTLQVDTAGWAAGLYVVRAQSESGVVTRRLTVVR